jgi:hypothetical protein
LDGDTLRILVCGGRDYCMGMVKYPITLGDCYDQVQEDYDTFYGVMDTYLAPEYQPLSIISGGARGADNLAEEWAKERKVPIQVFPVTPHEWGKYGKRAGYLRNQKMLDEGKPDLVIAFRGGKGTRMMIELAEQAGVKVEKVETIQS